MPQLVLSVPETVTSHYVIATSRMLDDPGTVVPWRVPEPFRAAAAEALRSPRLGVFTIGADEATWRLDDLLASDDDRRRVRESTHQVLVVHRAATVDQPFGEQTARAVARAIADATDGVLIDPQARQVVLRDGLARTERGWFRMGDQWFGTRYDVDDTSARSAHQDDLDGAESCSCLRITLLGLRRFGLPDLVIDDIACAHDLAGPQPAALPGVPPAHRPVAVGPPAPRKAHPSARRPPRDRSGGLLDVLGRHAVRRRPPDHGPPGPRLARHPQGHAAGGLSGHPRGLEPTGARPGHASAGGLPRR